MSSSELRLTYPAPGWSIAETNYPAGTDAWAATPVVHTPAADYFTPGIPIPAQDLNYLHNASLVASAATKTAHNGLVDARYADLANRFYTSAPTTQLSGSWTNTRSVTWSNTRGVWYRTVSASGLSPGLEISFDGGVTMTACATITGHTSGIPRIYESGTKLIAYFDTTLRTYDQVANTWSSDITHGAGAGNPEFFTLGANTFFWVSTSSTQYCAKTVNNGASWTVATSAIFTPATSYLTWRAASNGSNLVTVVSTYPSSPASQTYATSPDGVTFTARTGPWASTDRVFGLAYSGIEGIWMVVVTNAANTSTKFYKTTNPAGGSWTLAATLAQFTPQDLAVVDHVWLATGGENTFSLASGNRAVWSVDQGATWHWSQLGGNLGVLDRVWAGPHSFALQNNAYMAASQYSGAFVPAVT